MSMNRGLSGSSKVTTPQAQVEWTTTGPRDMYLLYDQAHYIPLSTNDGWWHRTLALDPCHWLRLSGAADISPKVALHTILQQPNRPAFTLSALVVALFLAHADHPDTTEQRQLFRWVAATIPELRTRIRPGTLQAGWDELSNDVLEIVLDGLLQDDQAIPYTFHDGGWAQALRRLAESLWTFPPQLIRQISSGAAMQLVHMPFEDEESGDLRPNTNAMSGWTVIGYLSAIRFWHEPRPRIRGLPIHTSMLEFRQLWHQALVIMHPDAPPITHEHLGWLCEGTVGTPADAPFDIFLATRPDIVALGHTSSEWQERIAMLQEDAVQGTWQPSGCWEIPISSHSPIFFTSRFVSIRVVLGASGWWVRLIPDEQSWGSVLWWYPDQQPPICWSLAFAEAAMSIPILALHAALWQLWRDFRVEGRPTGEAVRMA